MRELRLIGVFSMVCGVGQLRRLRHFRPGQLVKLVKLICELLEAVLIHLARGFHDLLERSVDPLLILMMRARAFGSRCRTHLAVRNKSHCCGNTFCDCRGSGSIRRHCGFGFRCVGPRRPTLQGDTAGSDSDVALHFSIPGGRPSSTGFATAAAAVTSALVVPFALDQKGPASPEDTASSDTVVGLYCAISGGRASSADCAPAVASALLESLSPGQEDPFSRGDAASSDYVETMCFAIPRGRPSPADLATAVAASTVMSSSPGQEDPALPEDTAISVEALCSEVPGGRASLAGFATAVLSALVVSFPPGPDDPASPWDTATSDSVTTLYSAMSRGRTSPTGFSTDDDE